MDDDKRWLKRADVAIYIGVHPERISQYVKDGKLPLPSLNLGPQTPRWDRFAIDALFEGNKARPNDYVTTEELVSGILSEKFRKRRKMSLAERKRRRHIVDPRPTRSRHRRGTAITTGLHQKNLLAESSTLSRLPPTPQALTPGRQVRLHGAPRSQQQSPEHAEDDHRSHRPTTRCHRH